MDEEQIGWEELSNEVRYAIEGGRKIEAIKLLREERGMGLHEAKLAVDRLFDEHAPESARGGCGGALFALVSWGALGAALAAGADRLFV